MASGADLSTLDSILKEDYIGPIRDQLNSETIMLRKFEQYPVSFIGREAVVPLRTGRNSGVGARGENAVLPNAQSQGYNVAKVKEAFLYGQYRVTGPAIAEMRSDRGAFERAQQSEARRLTTDFRKDANRQTFGDGTGTLATVSTAGGPENTIAVNTTSYVHVGDIVDILHNGAAVTNGSGVTVTAVTQVGGSTSPIYVNAITISGTGVTVAQGDIVTRTGSYNYELTGMQAAIINNTASYLGLDPATVPTWRPSLIAVNGLISETAIQEAADFVEDLTNERPSYAITTRGVRRQIFKMLQQLRRFQPFTEGKGQTIGGDEFEFDGYTLLVDVDCPQGTLFLISPDTWGVYQTEAPHWMDQDGTVLHRALDGSDAFYANLEWYVNIATSVRRANTALTGITE